MGKACRHRHKEKAKGKVCVCVWYKNNGTHTTQVKGTGRYKACMCRLAREEEEGHRQAIAGHGKEGVKELGIKCREGRQEGNKQAEGRAWWWQQRCEKVNGQEQR